MARYMRTDLGEGHSRLSPPAVVGAAVAFYGPQVNLRQVTDRDFRRLYVQSRLRPPTVVTPAAVFTAEPLRVTLAPSHRRSRQARFELRPPTILQTNLPTEVHLAPSFRGKPKSRLAPPTVVGAGIAFHGPGVYLTRPPRPLPAHSKLSAPSVVTAVVAEAYYGPQTWLTYSRRGKPLNGLGRPPLIEEKRLGGILQSLAPQRRGKAQSFLRPPAVVTAVVVQIYYGPEVTLTRIRPRPTTTRLSPPTILQTNEPTRVTLTYSRRGRSQYLLSPPQVVFLAVEIFGPEVHLTRIKHPPVRYLLFPPAVIREFETFFGPEVHLTLGRRPVTKSVLRPPTDTIGLEDQGKVQVHLAPQSRGAPVYRLSPPVVVFLAVEIYGPEVSLTRITPPPTISFLKPPIDVFDEQDKGLLEVHLTYSRRGAPKSRLFPPAVVGEVVYFGPSTELAPSFRGQPKPKLQPPTVVEQPPAFLPAQIVWLTPGRRPVTKSRLLPPAVTGAGKVNPGLRRYLVARKERLVVRATTSALRPPTVLFREAYYGPQVSLAPQRRGRPTYFLTPPAVVRQVVFFGPETELTYSRRGRPRSFRLPLVVGRAPFRGLLVSLTYSRRGQPKPFRTPEVVGVPPFRPIQLHLTRIKPPPVLSLLKPPTVVGAGVAFYGPEVHLQRIKPPPVSYFLKLTLVAFRRPQGDVCGFDIAGSLVCYLEVPGTQVSGTSSTGHAVSGSSRTAIRITGTQTEGGSVSGSDRKAT